MSNPVKKIPEPVEIYLTSMMRVGMSRRVIVKPADNGYMRVVGCTSNFCISEEYNDMPLGEYLFEFVKAGSSAYIDPIAVYQIKVFEKKTPDKAIAELVRLA